jgi:hypothetical protein
MADNTFNTARNVGFLERGGLRPIQVKDNLSSKDRTDMLRFTVRPGLGFRIRSSFQTQGGKMDFSLFIKDPMNGQFKKVLGPSRVSKGSKDFIVQNIPANAPPLDFYVKFDKPTQNLKYQFKLTSL